MIEREFISQKTKEFYIKKYIENKLSGVGISSIKLKKIPLGEKIIIHTNKSSIIVGSKGSNVKDLTRELKKEFNLDNPQIEINEVKDIFLDASLVADRIVNSLERFGSNRFKSIGHKIMENILKSGAVGVEIIISGKIPGARAKSWRFYQGYLKKCGDIAVSGVRKAQKSALLKSGIIGIKVAIMPADLVLPDTIEILPEKATIIEEIKDANTDQKTSPEGIDGLSSELGITEADAKTDKNQVSKTTKKSSAKRKTASGKKMAKTSPAEEAAAVIEEAPVDSSEITNDNTGINEEEKNNEDNN
ncbi:MAG TPA: 30S ribosomal protein S3 [Candidatus Nanoarchaeia archaeon]|nr:30S ribosomal protein S3 [Candidatus Nanoarchaeia archaeon]